MSTQNQTTVGSRIAGFAKGAGIVVGAIAGAVGAASAVGVAAEKLVIGRIRKGPDDDTDEAFGKLPADRSYTVVASDGLPLYVEEVGDLDAPLVLIFSHGYVLQLGSWHFQRTALTELTNPKVRMVFYDQRSHGRSGISEADHCTIEQLGLDLAEIIRASAGDRRVVLIGHSMGGMSIMGLAAVEPRFFDSQVAGVAFLSTAPGNLLDSMRTGIPRRLNPRVLPLLAKGAQVSPRLIEAARKRATDAIWLMVRRYSFGSGGASASLSDYVDDMIGSTPIGVIADFLDALAGHDKVAALATLRRTEVLIVCGTDDRLTPPKQAEALAGEIPGAELHLVEGAGHLAMMERPALVNLWLRAFVHRAYKRSTRDSRKPA